MGFISRLLRAEKGPLDDYWYQPVNGFMAASGITVTPETALKVSAVWACVRILAETLAQLPLITYRKTSNDGKERSTNHPVYDLLHDRPNRWQTSFEWREMSMGHLLLRGNAYSRIVPGPRGAIDQLVPMHPDAVSVRQGVDGGLSYRVRRRDGQDEVLLADEVFHLRGLSLDGVRGVSVLTYARESMGLAMSAEQYGSLFFSQGSSPSGVLTHPGRLSTEAQERIKASWVRDHSGLATAHTPSVLEEGLEWQQLGLSNEDSQFLETRKFQVAEFGRWFRVPPHMIGDLDRATFSNIEMQSLEFVIYTMMPWFRRWEQRINSDLILAPQSFFVEFLVDGLLRGDIASRYKAYAIGRQNGWLSVNDVRRFENMNPIEGGDIYLSPLNMVPADQLSDEQAELITTIFGRNGSHEI